MGKDLKKILIFGTGNGRKVIEEFIDINKCKIIAYIDNDSSKIGKNINGLSIISPENIKSFSYDYIIIASTYYNEIAEQLIRNGIDSKKILSFFKFYLYRYHYLENI